MVGKKSKILLILIIFVFTFNFCSPLVLAEGEGTLVGGPEQGSSMLGNVVDWGAGIFFYPIKFCAFWIVKGIHFLAESVAGDGKSVTPETILFNGLPLTDINFFETKDNDIEFVKSLKSSVASWYGVMRTIAIIASLCVLAYIAIRMAMSTVASEKAEYKRMLMDWAVGFGLIFVLHFIIIAIVYGNNEIVKVLDSVKYSNANFGQNFELIGSNTQITNFMEQLEEEVLWHVDFSRSIGALIVYCIFVAVTFAFLLMYIKRMIVVAFLIIISPLITITYAIDKVSDNKSQALDSWLKEFFWTVMIQPFHCVIYVVFVSISLTGLQASSLSGSVLAIMCMVFLLQAEDIIKKIFGIQADNIGKMSGSTALATGAMLYAAKMGGKKAGQGAAKASNAVAKHAAPKTKDGTGIGTGPTSSQENNSLTQKAANKFNDVMNKPAVQNSMKRFNSMFEDNKVGRAVASSAKYVGEIYTGTGYNMATGIIGASLNMPNAKGVADVVEGAMAGMAAGHMLKNGGKWAARNANIVEYGRTRNAVENLNDSYIKMKEKDNVTDSVMKERAKAYLKLDLEDSSVLKELSAEQRAFAYNLQTVRDRLEKAGKDASADSVIDKIKFKGTDMSAVNDTDTNAENTTNS